MSAKLLRYTGILALTALPLSGQQAGITATKFNEFEKDVLFNLPYSHTLGGGLIAGGGYGDQPVELFEMIKTSKAIDENQGTYVVDGKKPKLSKISPKDLAERRLDVSLAPRYKGTDGKYHWAENAWAVLFRLRDSFQLYNDASPGMEMEYKSFDGEEEFTLKGAIMADIYTPWLYSNGVKLPGFEKSHRFWFRTGMEFNRGEAEMNQFSYYLLLNAYANPDLNLSLFNDALIITSPQLLQMGVAFDEDRLSGEHDTRFVFSWQPALYLQDGFSWKDALLGKDKKEAEDGDNASLKKSEKRNPWTSFGINHKMYYVKGDYRNGLFQLYSPYHDATSKGDKSKRSDWYSYIPMDVSLSHSSEMTKAILKGEGFGGATVDWYAGVGIGNDKRAIRFNCLVEGKSPLSNLDQSRIAYSASLDFALGLTNKDVYDKDGKPIDNDGQIFSGMSLNAKYTTGEFGDHVGKHDEFTVGTRIRF